MPPARRLLLALPLLAALTPGARAATDVAVVAAAPADGIVAVGTDGAMRAVASGQRVRDGETVFGALDRPFQLLLADGSAMTLLPASALRLDAFAAASATGPARLDVTPLAGGVDLRLAPGMIVTAHVGDNAIALGRRQVRLLVTTLTPAEPVQAGLAGASFALGGDDRGAAVSPGLRIAQDSPASGFAEGEGANLAVLVASAFGLIDEVVDFNGPNPEEGFEVPLHGLPEGPPPGSVTSVGADGTTRTFDSTDAAVGSGTLGNVDLETLLGNPATAGVEHHDFFVAFGEATGEATPDDTDGPPSLPVFTPGNLPPGGRVLAGMVIVGNSIVGLVDTAAQPTVPSPVTGPAGTAFEGVQAAGSGGGLFFPTTDPVPLSGTTGLAGLLGSNVATDAQQQNQDQSAIEQAEQAADNASAVNAAATTFGALQAVGAGNANGSRANVTIGGLKFDYSFGIDYNARTFNGSFTAIQTVGEVAAPFRRIDNFTNFTLFNAGDPAVFTIATDINCAGCTADVTFTDLDSVTYVLDALGHQATGSDDLF